MIVLDLIIFMFLLFSDNGEMMHFKFNSLKTIVKEQIKCTLFMFNLKHSLKGTENSLTIRTINLL